MEIEELKQKSSEDNNNNNNNNIPIEYNEFYESVQSDYDTASENEDNNGLLSLKLYEKILSLDDPKNIIAKIKEDTIYSIGKLYIKNKQFNEFKELFIKIRPFFNNIPKARTAKIVRALIDMVGDDPSGLSIQSSICIDAIDWCKQSKRSFLKQRIQSKLAALYYKQKKYNDGLSLIQSLIREVRKFDDKLLMLEIYLIESKIFFSLENYQKSKASLTAARSSANAIYCPPAIQAEIDLMAGILCAKESDWKTAFSYFFESFEGFQTVKDDKAALQSLKYMILSKILLNSYDDVSALISGKAGIKYSGPELLAMKAVADAYKQRSIELFEDVYNNKYSKELKNDSTISDHLSELKETLLEQNLQKLIEPFTRVQISHLSLLIKLPKQLIENKLSEMILDKKLNGILDQGAGDLILFHNITTDQSYQSAIDTCKELSNVIDRLYAKAKRLTA